MNYFGILDNINKSHCSGWVVDLDNKASEITIELQINNKSISTVKATLFREGVYNQKHHETGYCGFKMTYNLNDLVPPYEPIFFINGRKVAIRNTPNFIAKDHFLNLRLNGYKLIPNGNGIEIGAFEHPARLNEGCLTEYCDAITPDQAKSLFPELKDKDLLPVDHIIDLNKEYLSKFDDNSKDYIIINHVLEHLVNPIMIISEAFRVLKKGGCIALAIPDKDYTFDKHRPLTFFEELKRKYRDDRRKSDIYDFLDIARYVHPHQINLPHKELEIVLKEYQDRKEHLNIWTSKSFKTFLDKTFKLLDIDPTLLYESDGNLNQFEYFAIFKK